MFCHWAKHEKLHGSFLTEVFGIFVKTGKKCAALVRSIHYFVQIFVKPDNMWVDGFQTDRFTNLIAPNSYTIAP